MLAVGGAFAAARMTSNTICDGSPPYSTSRIPGSIEVEVVNVPNIRNYNTADDVERINRRKNGEEYANIIGDNSFVLYDIVQKANPPAEGGPATLSATTKAFIRAGPRKTTYFDPSTTRAAIVTCGGLCPGMNSVIYHVVSSLRDVYGVETILGIKGGFHGLVGGTLPMILDDKATSGIQHQGGTILGSARGGFDPDKIMATLSAWGVNMLFVVGGDGTHRAANALAERAKQDGHAISIVGIPKTIDNDIDILDHSFGFDSAVSEAQLAIESAKTEAACAPNGIGIVKLMGRHAGFIAVHASLSNGDVDCVLIPELPVDVEDGSPTNILSHVERVVRKKGHAVVVVAEGAGEELLLKEQSHQTDASGKQPDLPPIGEYMKKALAAHMKAKGMPATIKYIDPSYMIRSVEANASDSYYAMMLAQNAVHGAMAGYTGFSPGLVNNRMVYIPITALVENSPRGINPQGRTIERTVNLTGQPVKR